MNQTLSLVGSAKQEPDAFAPINVDFVYYDPSHNSDRVSELEAYTPSSSDQPGDNPNQTAAQTMANAVHDGLTMLVVLVLEKQQAENVPVPSELKDRTVLLNELFQLVRVRVYPHWQRFTGKGQEPNLLFFFANVQEDNVTKVVNQYNTQLQQTDNRVMVNVKQYSPHAERFIFSFSSYYKKDFVSKDKGFDFPQLKKPAEERLPMDGDHMSFFCEKGVQDKAGDLFTQCETKQPSLERMMVKLVSHIIMKKNQAVMKGETQFMSTTAKVAMLLLVAAGIGITCGFTMVGVAACVKTLASNAYNVVGWFRKFLPSAGNLWNNYVKAAFTWTTVASFAAQPLVSYATTFLTSKSQIDGMSKQLLVAYTNHLDNTTQQLKHSLKQTINPMTYATLPNLKAMVGFGGAVSISVAPMMGSLGLLSTLSGAAWDIMQNNAGIYVTRLLYLSYHQPTVLKEFYEATTTALGIENNPDVKARNKQRLEAAELQCDKVYALALLLRCHYPNLIGKWFEASNQEPSTFAQLQSYLSFLEWKGITVARPTQAYRLGALMNQYLQLMNEQARNPNIRLMFDAKRVFDFDTMYERAISIMIAENASQYNYTTGDSASQLVAKTMGFSVISSLLYDCSVAWGMNLVYDTTVVLPDDAVIRYELTDAIDMSKLSESEWLVLAPPQ